MPRIALFLCLLFFCAAPAFAQLVVPESEPPPAPTAPVAPPAEGEEPAYIAPLKNIPEGPEMTAWAGKSVCDALNLHHDSYSAELKKASKNFSHPGWKQFTSDLLAAKVVDNMRSNRQNLSAEPCAEPTLTEITENGGEKKWHYTMPLMLQLIGDDIGRTMEMKATFAIERTLSHPDGLNITGWDWVEKN